MKNFVFLVVRIILFLIIMIIGLTLALCRDFFAYPTKWLKNLADKLIPTPKGKVYQETNPTK